MRIGHWQGGQGKKVSCKRRQDAVGGFAAGGGMRAGGKVAVKLPAKMRAYCFSAKPRIIRQISPWKGAK
ncbi:MAG: hypothetical protein ACYCX2_11945 [Christensenellales bacterium]